MEQIWGTGRGRGGRERRREREGGREFSGECMSEVVRRKVEREGGACVRGGEERKRERKFS